MFQLHYIYISYLKAQVELVVFSAFYKPQPWKASLFELRYQDQIYHIHHSDMALSHLWMEACSIFNHVYDQIVSDPAFSLTALFVSVTLIVLTTRYVTGLPPAKTASPNTPTAIPMLPYWIPFFGHIFSFALTPDRLLEKARYTPLLHPLTSTPVLSYRSSANYSTEA